MELVDTGIVGLNEMLGGGIPKGHTVVVLGGYGTGKTTMALHFANRGLELGEKVLYLSLEERKESILRASKQYGMNLDNENFILMSPGILDFLERLKNKENIKSDIQDIMPSRLIVDSVSIILMAAESESEMRSVLLNLSDSLKDLNVTTYFLAESKVDSPYSSRDGFSEFVGDGVISLQNRYDDEKGTTTSIIRILKMRLMNHDRKAHPYSISERGMEVLSRSDVYF